MKIRTNKIDHDVGTVDVTFTHDGVKHRRAVNYCRDAKGKYDAAATKARLAEVALGVENKIATGAIS